MWHHFDMSEYWAEDLHDLKPGDNTTPLEHIECSFVFKLGHADFDVDDMPSIDPKCESCPIQQMLRARAARLLMDRDGQKKFLIELMGEQGTEFEEHLMDMMPEEQVGAKKAEIIEKKEEVLNELDAELEVIQQEMSALSWDCLGVRAGEDISIGRPTAHYVFCDSELVNDAENGKPNPVTAYIWLSSFPKL